MTPLQGWMSNRRALEFLGLRLVVAGHPGEGDRLECSLCHCTVWHLRQLPPTALEPLQFEWRFLICDQGCNRGQVERPPVEILLFLLGELSMLSKDA